uniref:RING-type domain-containing protein n=1 Tax=Panagrellus redivivus TaxID=6233 RepID=A0A7E4W2R0_PANRE
MNDVDEEDIPLIPRFNYKILFDLRNIGDKFSCFAVHDKFIAVGCATGCIRIYDPLGSLRAEFTVKAHSCEVAQIVIDKSGSYVLSCSNDRSVNLHGIGCNKLNERFNVRAKSIAISENFTKRGHHKFLVGLEQLHLYEKGFLMSYNSKCLYSGKPEDGLIYAISWRGDVIAFTNETGTRIFDLKTFTTLAIIQPLHHKVREFSFRYPPRHSWLNDSVLSIGWASSVVVARIKPEEKKVEVIHRFQLGKVNVAGISYTVADEREQSDQLWREIAIFGVKVVEGRKEDGSISTQSQASTPSIAPSIAALPVNPDQEIRKQLMLVEPMKLDEYFIAAEDEITFKNGEAPNAFLHKYHMDALPGDSVYYLMSPEAVIEARPCSADNNVQWYLKNNCYVAALRCAIQHREELFETSVSEVGRQLIAQLMHQKQFDTAASYLPEICERHKDEWEYYVSVFENEKRVLQIVPYLPLQQPQLEPECYEYVLISALNSKAELFLKLIEIYPSDLYRIGSIIVKTLERVDVKSVSKSDRRLLFLALARLYAYSREFDKALNMFLQMKDTTIFQFIRQHHLFAPVRNKIVQLMEIDDQRAIQLLTQHEDEFIGDSGPGGIIQQLRDKPRLQMEYLSSVMGRGLGFEHADLLVRLYAEHAPDRLLQFLQQNDAYDLEQAIIECKKHKQTKSALVFLLGRTGNKLEALEAIENIDVAIDFCTEHAEEELWLRLIELATQRAEDVTKILSVAGTYIDPLHIIEKIPPKLQVPHLQSSLQKVLQDAKLQLALIEDCQSATFNDVFGLFEEFSTPPAAFADGLDRCCVCRKHVLGNPAEVLLLGCSHSCHTKCLKSNRHPSIYDNDDLRQQSFLAIDEDSPEPLPTAECPVCWTEEPANPFA